VQGFSEMASAMGLSDCAVDFGWNRMRVRAVCLVAMVCWSAQAGAQGYAGALRGLADVPLRCEGKVPCSRQNLGMSWWSDASLGPRSTGFEVRVQAAQGLRLADEDRRTEAPTTVAVPVAGALRVPLSDGLTGVGRLGLARQKGERHAISGAEIKPRAKLYSGVGLEYSLSNGVDLVGALDLMDTQAFEGASSRQLLLGAGAQVRF
jgi:hypothetical protein